MEFWVVAAATGAGYVAKHWQNLSEKDGSSKQSPLLSPRLQPDARQVFDKMPNPVFPLPELARRCFFDDDVSGSTPPSITTQVHTNEINASGNRIHKFRTKNMNNKPLSNLKPLVVTSNNKDLKDHKLVFMEENGTYMEADCLEPIGSVELSRRQNQKFDTGNNMVSLFVGIAMGILSTTVTNQREIDHLNDLLEQAENIVQDLHNKLEKKDGFTTTKVYTEPEGSPKAEKFELTSDIEAELEAELQRLEENMNQRWSNVVEIDSDYEADMARGDLNLDRLSWRTESDPRGKTVKSSKTETGNPVFTPNYAVSSLDLRIRLHEVIESNLQERIKELESLLKNQNTQNTPHPPDPQEENCFWDFDHTRFESFSSTP